MADKRTLAKRDAQTRLIKNLIDKSREIMANENYAEKEIRELNLMMKSIKVKKTSIADLQEIIIDAIEEEKIYDEMEKASEIDLDCDSCIEEIEVYLKSNSVDSSNVLASAINDDSNGNCEGILIDKNIRSDAEKKRLLRLPEFHLEKFHGDPLKWQSFIETFEAAVNGQDKLTDIEKFTYLKGYVEGKAAECINGFVLSGRNYAEALNLLKERFGNPQLLISTHMQSLLKLPQITDRDEISKLVSFHNSIESNIRSLFAVGLDSKQYGPLLIPVILERLPESMKLHVSRTLGRESWEIKSFLNCIKAEIDARESCSQLEFQKDDFNRASPTSIQALVTQKGLHLSEKARCRMNKTSGEKLFKNEVISPHMSHKFQQSEKSQSSGSIVSNKSCVFCKRDHYSDRCRYVTDLENRREIIKNERRCHRCLYQGHFINLCRSKAKCFNCKSRSHHTSLCDKNGNNRNEESLSNSTLLVNATSKVLLQTSDCHVLTPNEDKAMKVKVLLDSGSQQTYISERVVKFLDLKPIDKHKVSIKTFGNQNRVEECFEYNFVLKGLHHDGLRLYVRGLNSPIICDKIKGHEIKFVRENYPYLRNLELADAGNGGDIDLLIGADFYWNVIDGNVKKGDTDGPVALCSKFGWILSGPLDNNGAGNDNPIVNKVNFVNTQRMIIENSANKSLENKITDFWNLDAVGIKENEQSVYEKCVSDIDFDQGRYVVKLPFKENVKHIDDNFESSRRRLSSLRKRLSSRPEYLEEYNNVIKSQLSNGVIEKVCDVIKPESVSYLPHREVIREDKLSTKLRIVFDASAKSSGYSLNDAMYKGPCITPLLFEVLVRFRLRKIGIIADIEKAYLQISVFEPHRDFLRFIWYDDVFDAASDLVIYKFRRVIFGANCSQFLLNAVVRIHANKYSNIDEDFPRVISKSFYVDDLTTSVQSISEGIEMYRKIKLRFLEASFNVRKWHTNSSDLQLFLDERESSSSLKNKTNIDEPKVLGLLWNTDSDELIIPLSPLFKNCFDLFSSKRNILSVIASFYDPLGLLQPLVVKFKLLFQNVCLSNIGWDEEINEDLKIKWADLVKYAISLGRISVDRWYLKLSGNGSFQVVELHGFSDAAEYAYGCCVYIRAVDVNGVVSTSLVASKSRVAPVKTKQTIPRLELLGNLILARLLESILKALKEEITIDNIFAWTDSKVTLSWIRSVKKEFKTFVQNRVIEIRSLVQPERWYYCKTKLNPADIITRFDSRPDISKDTWWWKGPEFIRREKLVLEGEDDSIQKMDSESFEGMFTLHTGIGLSKDQSVEKVIHANNFSNVRKLFRVTAWVLRFCENLKRKIKCNDLLLTATLTGVEINNSKRLWIKANQAKLIENNFNEKWSINLNLMNCDGILRCQGRFKNLSNVEMYPIVLDRNHYSTKLLVLDAHERVYHNGVKQTLVELRSEFYIPRARQLVRSLLKQCVTCKRIHGRPYKYPPVSQLPMYRQSLTVPFSVCGVDYCGPVYVKDLFGEEMNKSYIVIYTCAATRGILIDLVEDGSSKNFINSIRRFIGRRGCPTKFVSDNGTVFRANETQKFCADRFIKWEFNVARAPWWGGFWERLVASVKNSMKKILRSSKLSYSAMLTVLVEIEAVLNNRPLCYLYDDDTNEVLTPSSLLFGRNLKFSGPENEYFEPENGGSDLFGMKKNIEKKISIFRKQWKNEYLSELRDFHKQRIKSTGSEDISNGDIVLIENRDVPRQNWNLGVVVDVFTGKDKLVRSAAVKLGSTGNVITRPVNRLIPIELCRKVVTSKGDDGSMNFDKDISNSNRPRREAAVLGELKRIYGNPDVDLNVDGGSVE